MHLSAWPYLLGLLAVLAAHRFWTRQARPPAIRFPIAVPQTVRSRGTQGGLLGLRYLGLALLFFALARPQAEFRQTERTVSGVDIMMVLDVSASMNIEDLAERPRLSIAKETMEHFIRGRQNDRIGFVVFSGEPLSMAPPTLDYGIVLKALGDAQTGVLKDGTAIGDGLALSLSHLRNSKAKSRVVVLLTDGDNNLGQVDPMTAGEVAAGYGVRVYTIAIGREGPVRLPIRTKGIFGNIVTTYQMFDNALNPQLLSEIAKLTGGKFYRVTEGEALDDVFKDIDRLERTEIKTHEKIRYEETFQRFLYLGLLLLLLEMILARTLWRTSP
jgi:Ca-activated chloride channel family protein